MLIYPVPVCGHGHGIKDDLNLSYGIIPCMNESTSLYVKRTRSAFLWTYIFNTPFWALYTILPFILYKDLNATPLQITLMVALKPAVSLFSLYWSAHVNQRPDRLLSNVIWASILSHLPFFFFPWINNAWLFVLASACYMLFSRGMIPAWTEILKQNIPNQSRQRIFAYGSALWYLGGAMFPFLFGWLLDDSYQAWRWLFPLTGFLSLSAIILQARIPIRRELDKSAIEKNQVGHPLIQPWKQAWALIRAKPDFCRYLMGFMLGGSGLIILQPVLPKFFMGILNLSYTELGLAMALCKGIGYAMTSPLWASWMNRVNIFRFSSLPTFLACTFPIFLVAAQVHQMWLYVAYFIYGIMQAGSELSWRLSGPIFSKDTDSSMYSSVNVLMVGVRGCIIPAMGSFFCVVGGPFLVLFLSGIFCLLATLLMSACSQSSQEDVVKT